MVHTAVETPGPERTRVLEALEPHVRTSVIARLSPTPAQFDVVDEITQKAMLALTEGISLLNKRTVGGLNAFASQVVRNKVADLFRDRRRQWGGSRPMRSLDSTFAHSSGAQALWQLLSSSGTSPSGAAARGEEITSMMTQLGQMRPRHREIIILAIIHGLPMGEIAPLMNISRPAASQLFKRAWTELQRRLGGASEKG